MRVDPRRAFLTVRYVAAAATAGQSQWSAVTSSAVAASEGGAWTWLTRAVVEHAQDNARTRRPAKSSLSTSILSHTKTADQEILINI